MKDKIQVDVKVKIRKYQHLSIIKILQLNQYMIYTHVEFLLHYFILIVLRIYITCICY